MYRFVLAVLIVALLSGAALAATGADISYTLPRDANVTINILSAKGSIVRELLRGEQQAAGKHTVHWDGCDQSGASLPPGNYTWKLLHHTGVKANYVLSVANSGQPPYRTDDDKGSWGGCHGNPLCVTADASGLYITWLMEEGNAAFTKTDYDGKAIYKHHSTMAWGRNYGSAVHNGILYRVEAAGQGAFLLQYDAATGKYVNWTAKSADISGGRLRLSPAEPDKKPADAPNIDPQAVAANDRFIAVSFPGANKVAVFTPGGEKARDITLTNPKGLAFLPDGRLAVCQEKQVVALNADTGDATPLLTQQVSAPWGIAVAQDGKSLWITDQGESHQVKQFDLTGKLLKTIGKPGGMPIEGAIDHTSFYMPRGIACGTDGNLYVTEDNGLRRISRWSPDGKLLREWFGPLGPQKTCWPNLNNFSEVYYQTWSQMIRCQVDLAAKTWYPVAWYQVEIPNGTQPVIWEDQGHKYLYAETSKLYIYNAKTDRWQVGVDFRVGTGNEQKIWTDLNGDGQQSDDELQPCKLSPSLLRFTPKTFVAYGVVNGQLMSLTPERITANGLPVYTEKGAKQLTKYPATDRENGWYSPMPIYGLQGCELTADGGVLVAYNGGRQQFRTFWDRASWNYMAKFDGNGELQWQAGVHTQSRSLTPGTMLMVMRSCGISQGVVFLTDVASQFHAYTEDGMYVATLMDFNDGAGGKDSLSPNSITVENVTGLVGTDPKTKKTYLFAGITEDARIWEITGLNTIQRMTGKVTLTSPDIPAVTAEDKDTYKIVATKPPRKPEYNDIGADGFLNDPEWQSASCLPLVSEGVLRGKFYLRYDDQYLWLGAQVADESPAKNAAQDPETAFTLGDSVDFYFGADPAAARTRTTGGLGDVRIVLAPMKTGQVNNGTIVMYRPKVSDGMAKKPYTFGSPVSEFTMDYVGELVGKDTVTNGGLCTFWRWRNGLGYTCEAKIPLSALPELGISSDGQPVTEHSVAFDAGVIFSNIGGTTRSERIYWHQDDANTHCITDLPTEAQLYPRLWGTAIIGARR